MAFRRLVVVLVLACAALVEAPAGAWNVDYGRVSRGDGVLHAGCHHYDFRYRVHPGNNDWAAEFFLVGPGHEGLGTDNKTSESHRKRGKGTLEVCRASTHPGRFTIRGKLTITRGFHHDVHWVKPAHFRLRRP